MAWYSRQAYLSYVFITTEQQMLRDSDDYAVTWRFLEYQLIQAHNYPKYTSNVPVTQALLMTQSVFEAFLRMGEYVKPEPDYIENPIK